MSLREENILLFDRYLQKEMDDNESNAFQEKLEQSASLSREFQDYLSFSNEIREGYNYHRLQQKLNDIHQKEFNAVGHSKEKKSRIIRPTIWITTAVAASIAMLIYFNPFMAGSDASEDYAQLSNNDSGYSEEMEYAESAEEATVDEIFMTDSIAVIEQGDGLLDQLPLVTNNPRGTAFQIDNNGHFLTAAHLVTKNEKVILQHKESSLCFEVNVIYKNDSLDLAILKSSGQMQKEMNEVPYRVSEKTAQLGDEIYALGYPKKDIVFTPGSISSETGYHSDSLFYESTIPSNAGHSGAPVFNDHGELTGIITAKNIKREAVTYILKPEILLGCLDSIPDSLDFNLPQKSVKLIRRRKDQIQRYRAFIFEVH